MSDQHEKSCPECHNPLIHKKYKIFHVWECPEQHGTYYPNGELENILKALAHLGDVDIKIWEDKEHFSLSQSDLMSPEGFRTMLEIRERHYPALAIYGDPETHGIWVHQGEEEKLLEIIEHEADQDSVGSYLRVAALQAAKIFDDDQPISEWTGKTLLAMKLLGERVMRSMPYLPF